MSRAPRRVGGRDGLRGLAALFVVVHHVFLPAFPGYPADRAPFWASPFIYGRFTVVVFIVLSGLWTMAVEGAAAWAFAAAGMGAEQGVVTAVVYGVMVFVACLPGAAVLACHRCARPG